jgi:hypothetical protein
MNNGNDDYRYKLETQIREAYGRIVYSQTTHEKNIQRLIKTENLIKIWQIILSTIIAGGFIGVIISDESVSKYIGTIASFLLILLNTYSKNFNLSESSQSHHNTAIQLWDIREDYKSLLTDFSTMNDEDIRNTRNKIKERTYSVYKLALKTDNKSYKEAQKALKEQEEQTFSDEEIDQFLPPILRRKVNKDLENQ